MEKQVILRVTPEQHDALTQIAKAYGFPTVASYLRDKITIDALATGIGAEAWGETLDGIAYVVMSHDERFFLTETSMTTKRGNAQYHPTMSAASERRDGLIDPQNWRVGIVKLQTKSVTPVTRERE